MRPAPENTVSAKGQTTVRDFLQFCIATSGDKIDEKERLSADLVNTFTKWFFADFTHITGTLADETDRTEVYNVYRTALRDLSIYTL
jgi:hypothetical protein